MKVSSSMLLRNTGAKKKAPKAVKNVGFIVELGGRILCNCLSPVHAHDCSSIEIKMVHQKSFEGSMLL